MHIVYILYISHFQALNLNPSSHWFWRTCACVSFFSSSCPSSFSPSSSSFSCCDGGQRKRRKRRSCLNRRRWCPEAAAAAAGSYQQEQRGGQEKRRWGLVQGGQHKWHRVRCPGSASIWSVLEQETYLCPSAEFVKCLLLFHISRNCQQKPKFLLKLQVCGWLSEVSGIRLDNGGHPAA